MAELRATKRNALLGLLADAFTPVADYLSTSTNPVEDTGSDLSVTGLLGDTIKPFANTVNRMSYGEPLTTGKGMTTQMRPDTRDALLGVLPMGPPAKNVLKAAKPLARDFVGTVGARNMSGMPMAKNQTGVIKVNFVEDSTLFGPKIIVNNDGSVTIFKPSSGFETYSELREKVFNAAKEKFGTQYDNYFRFTNNKDEIELAKKGLLRNSKNYAEGFNEKGLSVADGPHYAIQGYKFGYPVYGKHVGWGSDGEPLLDPKSIEVLTEGLLSSEEIVKSDRTKQAKILKNAGLPIDYFSDILFTNNMHTFK